MATYVPAKKNTAYIFYVGLTSRSNAMILQANPTLAAGDVKVATDDGAPANLTTLPVVDADFTKRVKVNLSADEMNGDNITIVFSDAAGDEWCDLIVNVQTAATQVDDLSTVITAGTWDLASDLALDFGTLLERVYQLVQNRLVFINDTGAATLRNIGDAADLATWGVTDDDTNTVRSEATWE